MSTWKTDWSKVDFSKPTRQLAAELGVSVSAVQQARALRKARPGYQPPQFRYAWGTVDWEKSDTEIARSLGCARSAVSKQRGSPYRLIDWSLSDPEIASTLDVPVADVALERERWTRRV